MRKKGFFIDMDSKKDRERGIKRIRKIYGSEVNKARKRTEQLKSQAAIRKISDPNIYLGPVGFNKPKKEK